jgi:hypothetical protein
MQNSSWYFYASVKASKKEKRKKEKKRTVLSLDFYGLTEW